MERRKFLKSIGWLSLVAAIFPEKLEANPPNLTGKYTAGIDQYDNDTKSRSKGAIAGNGWSVDTAIIPKGIRMAYWCEMIKEKRIVIYDSLRSKMRPAEMRSSVIDFTNPFIKSFQADYSVKFSDYNLIFKGCSYVDYITGQSVDKDGFCNYMSIERKKVNCLTGEWMEWTNDGWKGLGVQAITGGEC